MHITNPESPHPTVNSWSDGLFLTPATPQRIVAAPSKGEESVDPHQIRWQMWLRLAGLWIGVELALLLLRGLWILADLPALAPASGLGRFVADSLIFALHGAVFVGIVAVRFLAPAQRELLDREEKIQKLETRRRRFEQFLPVGIYLSDAEGKIREANDTFLNFVGYDRFELETGLLDRKKLNPAGDDDNNDKTIQQYQNIGSLTALEKPFLRRDGRLVWALIAVTLVEEQAENSEYFACVIDITQRKSAEEALRQSEYRARLLAETVPAIVWCFQPDGSLFYQNEAGRQYTGLNLEQLRSEGTFSLVHPDDIGKVRLAWSHLVNSGQQLEWEYRLRQLDGQFLWHLARVRVRHGADGSIQEFINTLTDIHSAKMAEAQARGAQEELELRVRARTKELAEANHTLQAEIQERQRIELALRDNEARFRALSESSPLGVFFANASGDCEYGNCEFLEILGLTEYARLTENQPIPWLQQSHPEDYERTCNRWVDHITNPESTTFDEVYRIQKSRAFATALSGRGEREGEREETPRNGESARIRGNRVRAQEADRGANAGPDGLAGTHDILGETAESLWSEPRSRSSSEPESASHSESDSGDHDNADNAAECWVRVRTTKLRDGDVVQGFVGTVEDISKQVIAAENIQRAQFAAEEANRAKTSFLAHMSHEIRTPLTGILGHADMLGDPDLPDSDRLRIRQYVRRGGEHLKQIISDILDLSKIELGKLELDYVDSTSPWRLVQDIASSLRGQATDKQLNLRCETLGVIPPLMRTDPTRLRQILFNLLSNAIKFADQGDVFLILGLESSDPETQSESRFSTDAGPDAYNETKIHDHACPPHSTNIALFDEVTRMKTASDGRVADGTTDGESGVNRINVGCSSVARPRLRIRVADHGIGITSAQMRTLFRPFQQGDSSITRKFGGTGLGLSICRHLCVSLNAALEVSSRPGFGSTFDLILPITPKEAERAAPVSHSEAPTPQQDFPRYLRGRILLAEDTEDVRRILTYYLTRVGLQLEIAVNGRMALEIVQNDEHGFDVILMDLQMPELDGYEATRQLRKQGHTGPIIALTAHATREDRDKCLAVGCTDYLSKPIDQRTLINTLSRFLITPR